MSDFATFRSVIELWPLRDGCATELGATPSQVSKWWQRDNIPAEWWSAVLESATGKAAGLSAKMLADIAARDEHRLKAAFAEART